MGEKPLCGVHGAACPGTPHHAASRRARLRAEIDKIQRRRDGSAAEIFAAARDAVNLWSSTPCHPETAQERAYRQRAKDNWDDRDREVNQLRAAGFMSAEQPATRDELIPELLAPLPRRGW
ncbi:hypothetical protein F4561_002225 [Lipingzhangella halophila]|uniref:Uncharacterized protein n=1 Tax=Lipingzhangella halophila TaxID=1783352 RepID=A0A7W7RG86_9ACTN|nr:hypothetical protein [Lipingzhangella halophila]MBB4931405.1 hypothetical protein [Lipingzhangella halophila]